MAPDSQANGDGSRRALRAALRELYARHGKRLLSDPQFCRSLLAEYAGPQLDGLIRALTAACEEQTPGQMLRVDERTPVEVLLARLTHQLSDGGELSEADARWATEAWAAALGLLDEEQCSDAQSLSWSSFAQAQKADGSAAAARPPSAWARRLTLAACAAALLAAIAAAALFVPPRWPLDAAALPDDDPDPVALEVGDDSSPRANELASAALELPEEEPPPEAAAAAANSPLPRPRSAPLPQAAAAAEQAQEPEKPQQAGEEEELAAMETEEDALASSETEVLELGDPDGVPGEETSAAVEAPPPSPSASSSSSQEIRSLELFFEQIWQCQTSNDSDAYAANYADQVDYCYKSGEGPTERAQIAKDRKLLVRQYPERSYEMLSAPQIQQIGDGLYEIRYRAGYVYSGPQKRASGATDVTLHVREVGGRWQIAKFHESVERD